jgi:subtilisin family serine protease
VHRRMLRTLSAVAMSVTLLVGLVGSAIAEDPGSSFTVVSLTPDGEPIQAAKSRSGRLAQTDPELLNRTDSTPVNVLVKLDYDAVASYAGDVDGLAATSPEITGRSLRANQAAVDAYLRFIERQEQTAKTAVERTVPGAVVGVSYQLAYGGFSMRLPANQVDSLLAIDGVTAVQLDRLEQPLTDASPEFIGAPQAWAQISDSTTAGEGVIVGVLDTGIWPEHPSFADNGISHPGGSYECQFGDGSDPALGDPFNCNNKLIGAYAFLNTYLVFGPPLLAEFCDEARTQCSARDSNGHGTHTAGTAAGSHVEEAVLLGVDRGPISGIAPGAHVIAYRVCLDAGCFQSDSVAAVNQAIADGVDVINFSISGGVNAFTDPVELAFLDAYAAGILVNASAGNSGPGRGTAHHAGPWTNTVGASTSNRHFLTELVLTGDDDASLALTGATVTAGVDPAAEVVLAQHVPGYGDPLCLTSLPDDSATGLVVACERGLIARVDKSLHVEPSGAVGMILYNLDPARGTGLNTDNHFIPSVHIDVADGVAFVDFMTANETVSASWTEGVASEVPGDVMAGFSSRGPVGDFLKPDVTAPGVQILAGNSPEPVGAGAGLSGQLFQAIQGTSMSSPHAAGVAALVKAAHPGWSPGQIKSALMTSSVQGVLKEDSLTPSTPFDRGAGSVRANRALNPTFLFDVQADDYYASAADPLGRLHLNLPSIYADPMPGGVVTQRTITNVTGTGQPVQITSQAPAGVTISVSPNNFAIGHGESRTLTITVSAPNLPDGDYFGQITVSPKKGGYLPAVLPVAFHKTDAPVTLDHACDPTTVERNVATSCEVSATNLAPVPAAVNLSVSGPTNRRIEVRNVSAPGVPSGNGFTWSGTLTPAFAPAIDAIEAGGQPFGYVPLSGFGVAPVAGMGDETIANFTVPEFLYGSEPYSRIGFTSNGYAVVGGGTAADVSFNPQTFPNPARPNNVLAPFWTDLDLSTGGAFRVATLSAAPNTWLVGDWEAAPTWESGGAVTNSFQVWILLGATEEITFTYGALGGPDSIGLTVGAENRDGTSGVNLGVMPAQGDRYQILTSPPEPGGSVTISYDAVSRHRGTHQLTASLTSNLFSGTAVKVVHITVE